MISEIARFEEAKNHHETAIPVVTIESKQSRANTVNDIADNVKASSPSAPHIVKGVEIVFASTLAPEKKKEEDDLVDNVVKLVKDQLESTTAANTAAQNQTVDLGIFGSFWLQTARPIAKEEQADTTQRPEPVFKIEDYAEDESK